MAFLAGMGVSRSLPSFNEPTIVRDTTIVYDTTTIEKPIYVDKIIGSRIPIPIIFEGKTIVDTITISDTTFIYLDKEQKYYKGDNYEAWVSGYQPNLDKINIFSKTTQVKETILPKKNFISLSAGVDISTKVGFPISLEYARNIGYFNLLCGFEYDILTESKTIKFGLEMPIIKW